MPVKYRPFGGVVFHVVVVLNVYKIHFCSHLYMFLEGGLELKETWLKYTSIFAIIFASDGLSTLFTDKIYSLCGVEKERANIEKELEELRIETEQNLNDKDENNKTKFSHKLLMITFVLCFLSIILIGLIFWIFLRVANLINGSG